MAAYKIYHKDGSILADANGKEIEVHSIEYNGTWMGECFVTATFENEAPIDFSIGDYIVYRNERFEINYDPGKIKCSSKGSYGGAFKYESVKFNALSDELVRCDMLDLVLYDNNLHYTALPKFAFYVESIDDLLDRIQANLDELYGKAAWKLYSRNKKRSIQRGCTAEGWESVYGAGTTDNVIDSTSIQISDQTCWDALSLVNSQFDVNFITRGRNVYVGTVGMPTANIFKYGKDEGLYEIEQTSESDQKIATRLRSYGSNKNIPSYYYADLGKKVKAAMYNVEKSEDHIECELGLDYVKSYFKEKRVYEGSESSSDPGWVVRVTFDFVTVITGYVSKKYDSDRCGFYSEVRGSQEDTGDEESAEKLSTFISQASEGKALYFTYGVYKNSVPSENVEYTENLPNNMACDRLMLPGFPTMSLADWWESISEDKRKSIYSGEKMHTFSNNKYRPYVDSQNVTSLGVRPSSVFFDQDDKTNGVIDIHPTIEEMEVDGVRIDEIFVGSSVEDNGRFEDGETVDNIDIYLKPQINFDINDVRQEDFTISMKDGMCAGRSFNIAACRKEKDGRWRLQIERRPDDSLGLYFPYRDFQIKKGDHFVLTGIELPDAYVEAASEKLLKYTLAYLDENDHTRYAYRPKVDEIFMARQHEMAKADSTGLTKSLYETIKEGDIMLFKDDDLGIDAEITIDQLIIKEEDGKIPTYEITLREEKEVGTIQKIQNQISSIVSGNGGAGTVGGGVSTTQIKNLIDSVGSDRFLSKLNSDTAAGIITFLQGLVSNGTITAKDKIILGEYVESALWDGRGGCLDKDGNAWLRNLTLAESLTVPKLSYNMVEICPGIKWQSAGGGTIKEVEVEKLADGSQTINGTITLDLKEGEIGQIAVGDLCMAVFHSIAMPDINAKEDFDSGTGTMTRAGFYTCYFRITDILETQYNSKARYVLRNDDIWPYRHHPSAQMIFVAFGNPEREERQQSCYQTTTYTRYLSNVTTWEFETYNIAMQLGDLSNLSVFGYNLQGYSAFLNNAYITGHIEEIRDLRAYIHISGLEDSHIEVGGSREVKMWLERANHNYHDAEWDITRESGLPEADAEWNEAHKSVSSPLTLTSEDMGEGAYLQAVMFTFTGRKTITDDVTGNPISFEGSTSAMLTLVSREQLHIEFQPVEGKSYVVKATNVDTIIEARLYFGQQDITDSILLRSSTTMKWTRDSGIPSEDAAWTATTEGSPNIIHIIDRKDDRHDCGSYWMEKLKVIYTFECNVIFAAEEISMESSMQLGNS